MEECHILNIDDFPEIKNRALFYPCSGSDLSVPIQMFSPVVTDFWFVDTAYFRSGRQGGSGAPADKQKPLLKSDTNYRLHGKSIITGKPDWDGDGYNLEPCVLAENYQHLPSDREIRIHRRRGYGFYAFRNVITSIGVFFYRGDSEGEGGSGNLWLIPEHINEVCDKLVDGGLIVTDGSQHGRGSRGEYEGFWKYREFNCPLSRPEAENLMADAGSFTDRLGRTFTCVGYAGRRYGPTLIWQVRK